MRLVFKGLMQSYILISTHSVCTKSLVLIIKGSGKTVRRIATSLNTDDRGIVVEFPTGAKDFSSLQKVRTDSVVHPACYPISIDVKRHSTVKVGRTYIYPRCFKGLY